MIGVIADPAEHDVVREFFELFKTPWEFYSRHRQYDVLLCAGDCQLDAAARLVVFFAGRKIHFDDEHKIPTDRQRRHTCILSHQGARIPIYGDTITFTKQNDCVLIDECSQGCTAYVDGSKEGLLVRVGYDLFAEVRTLLTAGQPPGNANMPALELHIALLRDLITGCGVPLVEIPPVPDGYRFLACLTHDVDHPSIREHKWDHTMFGFLYRAIFGSLRKLIRGQMSVQDLLRNWAAAAKLPFVHLGLAKDFWQEFDDCYLEFEEGLRSTFFVIPFRNRPGANCHGPAPMLRAARYGAPDIASTIRKLITAGSEVGLHGIDAWLDSSRGHEEIEQIRQLTGVSETGVRMHWLYYDQRSPSTLETAGASYDSTIGYNETVGYRAGTTQVYKPFDASELLEMPLHVMDTALFYPNHLDLSPRQARVLLASMVENAVNFGGTFTTNWHDRSLAPERLWGGCYRDLIRDLKNRGAWFATAGQAISWFRKRRSAWFEVDSSEPHAVRAKVAVDRSGNLPGLRLRIHKARKLGSSGPERCGDYVDTAVDESIETLAPSEGTR